MLDRFPQRDLGLWVFMCPTNNTRFCLYFLSLFCVSLSGYHAEGYHVPSLPPRAITPVHTSRLPHQSYHAPPTHVHRVITPAISYSYFIVYLSPASTPPVLLLLHHHRAPHATTYSTRLATAFWPAIQQNACEGGQSCAGPGHRPEYLRDSCCPVSHRQDISVFSGQDR